MNTRPIGILLLEDNPDDAYLLRLLLAKAPGQFQLTQAERLGDALKLLEAEALDVVLTDLHLPDAVGEETVRGLFNGAKGVPILVLSGSDDPELHARILREGACQILSKDNLNLATLSEAIRQAVEQCGKK